MHDDCCFTAIEHAVENTVARLLSTSTCTGLSVFRHSLPQRLAKDDVIPLMAEIDEDLRRLQHVLESLTRLRTWLTRWKGRANDARPIGALPVELLIKIFDQVRDDTKDNKKAQAVVRLSHVASSWRAITLSHGALWSDIYTEWDFARQDVWLKRSGNRPLRILAESNKDGIYPSPNVGAAANRVKTIIAQTNYYEINQLFPADPLLESLPALQHIELNMEACDEPYAIEPWIMFCPRLQHVILHGVSFRFPYTFNIPPLPWKELRITGGENSARGIFKLLGSCQQLRILAVHDLTMYPLKLEELENLQARGLADSGLRVLPLLEELYVKTSHRDDCFISFMSCFISTPILSVFGINCEASGNSDESLGVSGNWECVRNIGNMLGPCPHLNTLELQGHPDYFPVILDILTPPAKHPSNIIPDPTKLAIDCSSEREETWACITEYIIARANALGGTVNVLEELTLFGAPGAWHGRTIPFVDLVRFTTGPPSDIVIRDK